MEYCLLYTMFGTFTMYLRERSAKIDGQNYDGFCLDPSEAILFTRRDAEQQESSAPPYIRLKVMTYNEALIRHIVGL